MGSSIYISAGQTIALSGLQYQSIKASIEDEYPKADPIWKKINSPEEQGFSFIQLDELTTEQFTQFTKRTERAFQKFQHRSIVEDWPCDYIESMNAQWNEIVEALHNDERFR